MRKVGVLITCLITLLVVGAPAFAHGGPIKLEVQGDGGQGVTAVVTYQNDGHPVADAAVSYTAASTGRSFGPVRLVASNEGQSFYVSEQPLPVGAWTVTVTVTRPSAATKTVAVTSKAVPAAPAVAVTSNDSTLVILISIGAVLLVVAAAVLFRWRRRHT